MNSSKDLEWKKEHFVSQIKGDYEEPSRCPRCTGNNLNKTDEGRIWWKGWICKDCLNIIDGNSFYQGRNNGRVQLINEEIRWLEQNRFSLSGTTNRDNIIISRIQDLNKLKKDIMNPKIYDDEVETNSLQESNK